MQRTGPRDTAAERAVRTELHRRGLRYFVDRQVVEGSRRRVDIVFPRRRVAVYVDGCFWHWCPSHRTIPKANRDWWVTKLEANEARDRATDVQLEEEGWTVLRFWEHEDPVAVADAIEATVRGRGQEERERETTPM
jgi:DNA mismatch endonuclease (patch repair protein)